MPVVGLYAATKWAVEALAETYRYDLKPCGIDVSIVQPGAYPTDFGSGSPFGADQDRANGYGVLAGALDGFVQRMRAAHDAPGAPDPQAVADAIVALVETPAGQRPPRVRVDASNEPFTAALNDAHAQIQRQVLQSLGMGALAD
jgi:NAD(P)-dependent dehydrogenase (short-subunit alcohol dehydrogenase family)